MADVEKLRLSSITWESDTNEEGFYIYIEDFGAMARAIKCGCELEDMLDSKLRRAKTFSQSVPSFLLDDPDFMIASAPAPRASSEEDADGDSASNTAMPKSPGISTSSAASGSHFTLGVHHTAYQDLSDGAKSLDAMLYNILKMSIKGSKQALLKSVTFPSYVQAVCVLAKHMGISRMKRIMAAFNRMDTLQYTGDTTLFQSQFLAAKRELDSCNATVVHYTMCKLMKSFDGRSKTTQFKIAEDFNRLDFDDPNINLYDLVQGYLADLAAIGDTKPHRVGMCTACNSTKHETTDCPKGKQDNANDANSRKNRQKLNSKKHSHLTCHNCNKKGHISPNCDQPLVAKVNMVESAPVDTAALITAAGQAATPPATPGAASSVGSVNTVNTGPLSPAMLTQLVQQLRGPSTCGLVTASSTA